MKDWLLQQWYTNIIWCERSDWLLHQDSKNPYLLSNIPRTQLVFTMVIFQQSDCYLSLLSLSVQSFCTVSTLIDLYRIIGMFAYLSWPGKCLWGLYQRHSNIIWCERSDWLLHQDSKNPYLLSNIPRTQLVFTMVIFQQSDCYLSLLSLSVQSQC